MRVFERVLFKRYNCLGLQDWCVEFRTITAGSVGQVFEGRHYYRSMRVHKKGFDTFVQRRVKEITNNPDIIHLDVLSNLSELRQRPSSKALEHVKNLNEYKELVTTVLSTAETRSQMVVSYLKVVSTMLTIISRVLQAKRQMLKFIFTFDHIKYARYNSFQQAFGVTAAKPTDLHEAFSYPTTSLPLSIASPNSSLYQSEKAGFRNIMKSSNSVSSSFP